MFIVSSHIAKRVRQLERHQHDYLFVFNSLSCELFLTTFFFWHQGQNVNSIRIDWDFHITYIYIVYCVTINKIRVAAIVFDLPAKQSEFSN